MLDVLAEVALSGIVRGTLLIAAAVAFAPLLRWAGPETRHALWGATFAALVGLFAAAPWAPKRSVVLPAEVTPAFLPSTSADTAPETGAVRRTPRAPRDPERSPTLEAERSRSREIDLAGTARRGLGLTWILGTLIVAVSFLARRVALARAAAGARPVDDPRMDRLTDRLGLAGGVRLLRARRVHVPVTWGTVRPVILLPWEACDWPASRLECVLLHELAHVRRRDALVQGVARMACALHWYNPLVWHASRRLQVEAEAACDGAVLASGIPARRYAGALVAVLEGAVADAEAAGMTLASVAGIERRVRDILSGARPSSRRGSVLAVVTAVLAAGVIAATASLARADATWERSPQDPIVAALVRALHDEAPFVRRSAINALRDVGDSDGIEAIRALLDDPDPDVRQAAEVVSGLHPARPNKPVPTWDPPALEGRELETAMDALDHSDPRVRERAAGRLQAARGSRAVAALVSALGDADEHVRRQAAESLGRIADPAATLALIRATRDPDAHVRQSAVGALGAIGRGGHAERIEVTPDAAAPPKAATEEAPSPTKNPEPEEVVTGGSRSGAPPGSGPTGSPVAYPTVCAAPSGVLAGLGGMRVGAEIRALLVEPDPDRRTRAAWSLGHIVTAERPGPAVLVDKHPTPRDAREALMIASYDPHRPVRLAAACSLARIGDTRAVEHLERRARDSEIQTAGAAAWAIDRIRSREAAGG